MKTNTTTQLSTRRPVYRFAAPAEVRTLQAEVARLQTLLAHQSSIIEDLSKEAARDPLTNVLNRRGMEKALHAALSDYHRYGYRGAVLLIDLNHFKPINDTYGHAAGDAMLVHVANLLRSRTRESDIVARTGGDEFVVVLREAGAAEAAAKAADIARTFAEENCAFNGLTLRVSASIGAATFKEAPMPDELLALADQRMYIAKTRTKAARA